MKWSGLECLRRRDKLERCGQRWKNITNFGLTVIGLEVVD
jgi:hypothetical protein